MRAPNHHSNPPAPGAFFGRKPLADDVVIRWEEMLAYFNAVSTRDARLHVEAIGQDWSSRPLVLLTIGPRSSEAAPPPIAITASIHAHELAGCQMMPDLVFELLTTDDPTICAALESVTLLIVPCLNPGGLELVADWRAKTKGTAFAGSLPPGPMHPIGHDLNRDWILQTQPETRAVVERVFNRWRPRIVLDLHEMVPNGPRYALPPYVEPVDLNLPDAMRWGAACLGRGIAETMAAEGKTGVTTGLFFDGFSPARAYSPYHGGIRVLAEAAGTRLGLPVHLSADELASSPDFDPRHAAADHCLPWMGGRWALADVARYHRTAILATLLRGAQLDPFESPTRPPESFIILPLAMQRDSEAAKRLLETLDRGGIEMREAEAPFSHNDVLYPVGTFIVGSDQPNWPWAKTLLSVQHYPAPPGGSAPNPYDVTAQTLPLLMGVDVIWIDDVVDTPSHRVDRMPARRTAPAKRATVGVYCSRRPGASEAGWAISMLEDAGIATVPLSDSEIQYGGFSDVDVIILPHQEPDHLMKGLNLADYPSEHAGGVGQLGMKRLKRWVADGGCLIAIDGACRAVLSEMNLPVETAPHDYHAPGSILRVELDLSQDVTRGCERELAVMSLTSVAFSVPQAAAAGLTIIARYPADDPLLSGWLSGWKCLARQAAIVEQRLGKGKVLLFGCRPLFRGQTLASQRLVVNAIRQAAKDTAR